MAVFDRIPWWMIAALCLTLGLAPFFPEPHIWEKLKMLLTGQLVRPIDIFDFAYHGLPWMVGIAKFVRLVARQR